MRIFAGGGARSPPPPYEIEGIGEEGAKITYLGGGHPSAGDCRNIGFPLCQELLQVRAALSNHIATSATYFVLPTGGSNRFADKHTLHNNRHRPRALRFDLG